MTDASIDEPGDAGGPPPHLTDEIDPDRGEAITEPIDPLAAALADAVDVGGPPADLLFEMSLDEDLDNVGAEVDRGRSEPGPVSGGSADPDVVDAGPPPPDLFELSGDQTDESS